MKYNGLDILRGLAAFGIVGVHLSLSPMTAVGYRIHHLCDMNVGLFAGISGFLMYESVHRGTFISYLKKRCCRLLPVYFVWTFIFIIFGFIFDIFVRHGLNEKWLNLDFYPKVVFGGQASAHLWFLICLLYVQMVVMAAKKLLEHISWVTVLSIGFFAVSISSYYMDIWLFGYPIRMLGFLLSGYALRMCVNDDCLNNKYTFVCAIIAGLFIFVHLYFKTPKAMIFIKDWFVAMPILFAFVTVPSLPISKLKHMKLLGVTSMGVYLIHPIITAGVGLAAKKVFEPPFGMIAIMSDWLVCYALSFLCAVVMCRMPRISRFMS